MRDKGVFLDTNVLLYLLSGDDVKADVAETLLSSGGVISVQVLNEFSSVCRRKLQLDWADVHELLASIRACCDVVPVTLDVHTQGLQISERYGFSIYDAMIISAALFSNCHTLLSEDMQHGQSINELLVIRNPFSRDN